MLATREQAGTVRPADELQERPAGKVPVKPTISWLRNLRPSDDQQAHRSRERNNSANPRVAPDNRIIRVTSPRRRTIEVKTKIIKSLLNPERGTLQDLGIQKVDGQFADKEVEIQYKEFIRLLRVWSLDSAHPENDPLREFNEYHTFTFKRVYRKIHVLSKEPELRPYICFIGFNSEEEVKRAHAKLASKRVRSRYCPLLGLCYDLDWEQLSSMPSASLLRDAKQHTLCGNLVSIGEGKERHVLTIGGLVTDGETTWALTAGHLPKEAQRSRSDSDTLTENDLDLSEYNEDVEPPVIIIPATASPHTDMEPSSLNKPHGLSSPELGDIEMSGEEWSLIRLKNETLALPNCAIYKDQQPVYLFKYAESPLPDNIATNSLSVTVLGGVTGLSQVLLLSEKTPMRLPGGKWVDAWVAEAQTESQLRRGDSGSWVVDLKNGIVYGHVLLTSGRTIYILSLADIFHEVSEKNPSIKLDLVQPFISLERLASTYYTRHNYFKSKYYAEQALQTNVIRVFRERSESPRRVDEFIQWASKQFGLKVNSSVHSMFQSDSNLALDLAWSKGAGNDLDPAQFDMEMTAPGPSQVRFANPSPEKSDKEGPNSNRLEKVSQMVGDWGGDLAPDTLIDERLFLMQITTLQSIPEPAYCLELLNYADPTDLVVKRRRLTDGALRKLLVGVGPFKQSDSLRASPFLNGENVGGPQAFSQNVTTLRSGTYKLLVQEMKLPLIVVEASATAGPFFWWTHNDQSEDPYLRKSIPAHFIFRNSQDRRQKSSQGWEIILSNSVNTRITSGYVRWTADASIQQPFEQLMSFSKPTAHPLMLPLLVLQHNLGAQNDQYYRNSRDQVRKIESDTMQPNEARELKDLFREAIECQIRVLDNGPQVWLHIASKVTQAMNCYWALLDQAEKSPEQEKLHQMLMGRLSFLTGKLESAEHYINTSSERLRNILEFIRFLQTVKKSKLDFEILAALKRQTGKGRYFSDKQLIILLAVFLPAIFIASFLSTSFFNFSNGIRGPVSNKLWIYFVVAVPLATITVGVIWAHNRKIVNKARSGDELEESDTLAASSVTMTGAGTSEDVRRRRKHWTGFSAFKSKV
ncbi:hypothetical protein F4679DRAFT_579411 [Xylaria curta]|nr:hypothetical protein F4679DRAFT_579411 [Xylaria curta]